MLPASVLVSSPLLVDAAWSPPGVVISPSSLTTRCTTNGSLTSLCLSVGSLASHWPALLMAITGMTMAFLTVMGNLVVLVAFCLESTIRVASQYFLASLAVSDLLTGLISMPLFLQFFLVDDWLLGDFMCNLWILSTYGLGLVARANILLITLDRFFLLHKPFQYKARKTPYRVVVVIVLSWVVALTLSSATEILVKYVYTHDHHVVKFHDVECMAFFPQHQWVLLAYTLATFWLPLVVMVVLYVYIYDVAHKRQAALEERMACYSESVATTSDRNVDPNPFWSGLQFWKTRSRETESTLTSDIDKIEGSSIYGGDNRSYRGSFESSVDKGGSSIIRKKRKNEKVLPDRDNSITSIPLSAVPRGSQYSVSVGSSVKTKTKHPVHSHRDSKGSMIRKKAALKRHLHESSSRKNITLFNLFSKDVNNSRSVLGVVSSSEGSGDFSDTRHHRPDHAAKAFRTISTILGTFALCWTPYHVITHVIVKCPDCVSVNLYSLLFWLTYLNSMLNPFCYAFANKTYKNAMIRIARFDWHRS